ncbi:electron carrier/ protein disulfide oxidoreductase [Anaeramoeba flamelloides]|uniref:Electron carrier/ protein disulfide oxidoreductase n=1 Tax=Anaeramoeba flamelloides TaxID=1746091 RepID=A0ABQ8Y493_9EUKA|nr:electron carrier/ protein disulfide oxidoreductase [Anaeramoeba flamelloides]
MPRVFSFNNLGPQNSKHKFQKNYDFSGDTDSEEDEEILKQKRKNLYKKFIKLKIKQNQLRKKYKSQSLSSQTLEKLLEKGNERFKEQTLYSNRLREDALDQQQIIENLEKRISLLNREENSNESLEEKRLMYEKKHKKIGKLQKSLKKKNKLSKLNRISENSEEKKGNELSKIRNQMKEKTAQANDKRILLQDLKKQFFQLQLSFEQKKNENSKNKDYEKILKLKQNIQKSTVDLQNEQKKCLAVNEQKEEIKTRVEKKSNDKVEEDLIKCKVDLNRTSEINNQLRIIKKTLLRALNRSKEKAKQNENSRREVSEMGKNVDHENENDKIGLEDDIDEDVITEFDQTITEDFVSESDFFPSSNKIASYMNSQKRSYSKNDINSDFSFQIDSDVSIIEKKNDSALKELQILNQNTNKGNGKEAGKGRGDDEHDNVNGNEEEKERKQKNKIIDLDSIDTLFSIPMAIEYFKEFMFEQLNQENLLFYIDVMNFTKACSSDKKQLQKIGKNICEKYIKINSLFEINIDSKCRSVILQKMKNKNYSLDMFVQAKQIVFNHMNLNSFEEFKKSNLYRKLLKASETSDSFKYKPVQKAVLLSRGNQKKALNQISKYKKPSRDGSVIVNELISTLIELFGSHFSISTNEIDFKLLQQSIAFNRFVNLTTELQKVKFKKMNQLEKICFFINIHNCLFLHSAIINGIPTEESNWKKFKKKSRYLIGGMNFSIENISKGILRGNTIYKNKKKLPYFQENDPRSRLAVNFDTRVLFTLFHYEFKELILIPFTSDCLIQELNQISISILRKNSQVLENKKIIFPKIFKSFINSFGKNRNAFIQWILKNILIIDKKKKNKINIQDYSLKFTMDTSDIQLTFDSRVALWKYNRHHKRGTLKFKKIDSDLIKTETENNHTESGSMDSLSTKKMTDYDSETLYDNSHSEKDSKIDIKNVNKNKFTETKIANNNSKFEGNLGNGNKNEKIIEKVKNENYNKDNHKNNNNNDDDDDNNSNNVDNDTNDDELVEWVEINGLPKSKRKKNSPLEK